MPSFGNRVVSKFARNLKAGLTGLSKVARRIRTSSTTQAITNEQTKRRIDTTSRDQASSPEVEYTAFARQTALAEQNQELNNIRQKLRRQNKKIRELQARLAETQQESTNLKTAPTNIETPPPFFVVGQAKSGTSWVASTLSAHPEILCLGEAKFFGRDFKKANPSSLNRASLHSAFADSEDLENWFRNNDNWTSNKEVDLHIRNLVHETMDYLFANARSASGKPIIGDKTPFHVEYLDEIHEFYPNARIIHVIRDGRDQAISARFYLWKEAKDKGGMFPISPEIAQIRDAYYENPQNFGLGKQSIFDEFNLKSLAHGWVKNVEKGVESGRSLFNELYFEVKYEELLSDSEYYFGQMMRFLSADARKEIVEDCVRQNSFAQRSGNRARGIEDPNSFYRKGIAGDWKNYFTERDKQIFKEEAGDLLIRLGYEEDYDW